jgi:flavin reductase (DIM6/NTAB) family NADH-FMN oxidoreductase RutF
MTFKKVSITDITLSPFDEIGNHWILLSATKNGVTNTMTASWGGLGVLWGKNVATVYIRPQRYTKEFVDQADYFTVTFFDSYKKELGVLGTKSGRDGDKIGEVGFNLVDIANQPTFIQGKMTMICKKLYADVFKPECFIDTTIPTSVYPDNDYHTMYVGEIIEVYKNEKE